MAGISKYYDLPRRNGRENMGGFSTVLYFAPISSFTDVGLMEPVGGNEPGQSVLITSAHVFKTGKGWIKAHTTLDTAKLASEQIGERGGRAQKQTGEFFYPAISPLATELARNAQNDEFIILLKDINPRSTDRFIQIGSRDLPAEIMSKLDSGTISSGRKGYTFMFEAFAHSLAFYTSDPETALDPTYASTQGAEDNETYID